MAYKLNGNRLPIDKPFSIDDINYPANWLKLSTSDERKALGITEEADPVLKDQRFYNIDGSAKEMEDKDAVDQNGDPVLDVNGKQAIQKGLKTLFKDEEKYTAQSLLNKYDWQVVRKAEKGTAMDSDIVTYRDSIRAAYETRKTEIDACSDAAALETLFGATYDSEGNWVKHNMTQYPDDPNRVI
mgnify:CR=1 FL=1